MIRNKINLIIENEFYINNEFCPNDAIKIIIEHKLWLHYCNDIIWNNLLPNENNELKAIFLMKRSKEENM